MKSSFLNCLLFLLVFAGKGQAQSGSVSAQQYTKGMQHFQNARFKEAIVCFDKAIQADSSNYNAWVKRGFAKGRVGDFEGEINDYTHVIAAKPDHIYAYISRGSAYNRMKKFDEAIADFDAAEKLDNRDPEVFNNRGFAYKGKGDMDAACKEWNTSRKLGNSEASVILKNNQCK